jgi:hypothetical protein
MLYTAQDCNMVLYFIVKRYDCWIIGKDVEETSFETILGIFLEGLRDITIPGLRTENWTQSFRIRSRSATHEITMFGNLFLYKNKSNSIFQTTPCLPNGRSTSCVAWETYSSRFLGVRNLIYSHGGSACRQSLSLQTSTQHKICLHPSSV